MKRFFQSFAVLVAANLLTSASALTINAQPQPQLVNQGQAAQFNVVATGAGTLTYQWHKDGVAIPLATSSSYNIASAQPWHIASYSVRVTDSGSSDVTAPAVLTIPGVNSNLWNGLIIYYPFEGNAETKAPQVEMALSMEVL